MADSYVCSTATLKCPFGDQDSKLTVYPDRTAYLSGKPTANVSDHVPMYNIAPFGKCKSLAYPPTASATAAAQGKLTPMPCVPGTTSNWMKGKSDYLIKGQPALLKSSLCRCQWGGVITIKDDGQTDSGPADLSRERIQKFNNNQSDKILDDRESENHDIEQSAILGGNVQTSLKKISTINQKLCGDKHPETGVPFIEKTVITDTGEPITGVFPQFDSALDLLLPDNLLQESDKKQFALCNQRLKEKCEQDIEFRKQFNADQLNDIYDGQTPDGYTWHHNEEKGKMQLIDSEIHGKTGHTGGRSIWGGGTENR